MVLGSHAPIRYLSNNLNNTSSSSFIISNVKSPNTYNLFSFFSHLIFHCVVSLFFFFFAIIWFFVINLICTSFDGKFYAVQHRLCQLLLLSVALPPLLSRNLCFALLRFALLYFHVQWMFLLVQRHLVILVRLKSRLPKDNIYFFPRKVAMSIYFRSLALSLILNIFSLLFNSSHKSTGIKSIHVLYICISSFRLNSQFHSK